MPVNLQDVMELLSLLADEEKLKVTVTGALRGGLITGASATVGGLLAGPIGMAAGGALGGATAAYMSWGQFQPVSQVILNLDETSKKQLYEKVIALLNGLSVTDLMALNAMVMSDSDLRGQFLSTIVDHMEGQLKLQIID